MRTDFLLPIAIAFVVLFLAELIYFRIARHFRIIDKPNERSSHAKPVIRGGGVIFIIGVLLWFAYEQFSMPWFTLGLFSAALISFADDIRPQPARVRFLIHLIAIALIFQTIGLFAWPWWLLIPALIVSIGALNAFNFMDGINGITGVYALTMLLTFIYIDQYHTDFISDSFLMVNVISVIVFLFFNFRKKASCFAGDVGSVTMAFILIFLLLKLTYDTNNLLWVMLVLVYGIDSVITILYRLKRGENIFKPHRTHLYQYLCNEFKWPHRLVSALYGIVQLLINVVVIYAIEQQAPFVAIGVGVFVVLAYLGQREYLIRRMAVS